MLVEILTRLFLLADFADLDFFFFVDLLFGFADFGFADFGFADFGLDLDLVMVVQWVEATEETKLGKWTEWESET